MIERVVLELDHETGEWSVRPDKGQPITGLANLWEAGQVAGDLDGAACTPGAPVAGADTRPATQRTAKRKA